MLQINNLNITGSNKELLNNVNLKVNDGEIHVLMGPNGAGKSTICKAIMSHPSLVKTSGSIVFNGMDITNSKTDLIAKEGIYYISQSPYSVEGVSNAELIRTSLNEKNEPMDIFTFNKECKKVCEKLGVPKNFIHRDVNVDMSGGEKKKNELIGMWFLKPKLIILDEIDSGLDVDAIKVVANNLMEYQKESNCSILIVSHQPMLLEILKPKFAHLVINKTIYKDGDYSLITNILSNGFKDYGANVMATSEDGE